MVADLITNTCLDEQTEVLASSGWVGIDDISLKHRIAAWNHESGLIEFTNPLTFEVRSRRDNERMVALETPRRSVRFTADSRIAYMDGGRKSCQVAMAKEIIGRPIRIPISGLADPLAIESYPELISEKTLKARVRSCSYIYRQQGMCANESRSLAEHRCRDRAGMKRKPVCDLEMADLHLIGMWVGDGTATHLRSGGIEYSISQSLVYPEICSWIRNVINSASIDFVERFVRPGSKAGKDGHQSKRFSMPRGTGFGPQQRRGVYHLEQYLSKTDFRWLAGLTREQLIWFIEGLWMADGEHGNCADPQKRGGPRASSWRISSANSELNDWLQAVCACRGLAVRIAGGSMREGSTRPLWTLNISRRIQHIATKYTFRLDGYWKQERVWCVESSTGFIVTRRNGSVTITG